MTEFEKQRLQVFGRGYYNFLLYQMDNVKNKRLRAVFEKALKILEKRYLKIS